jgi:hypothetical protein
MTIWGEVPSAAGMSLVCDTALAASTTYIWNIVQVQ